LLPLRHRLGEAQLREWRADRSFDVPAQRGVVEPLRGVGSIGVHRLALDKLPLHDIKRRELVMEPLERAHFGLDTEQEREKVLEVRSDRDKEFRLCLAVQRVGMPARGGQTIGERRIGRREMGDEELIDARGAVHRIEIGERETVRKRQGARRVFRHTG
jgi:hypothetical protein